MAQKSNHTADEVKQHFARNEAQYAEASKTAKRLKDTTRSDNISVSAFNKENLISYMSNIGSNERNLRSVSQYLYYRSHIYMRLVHFYADMFDLRCRLVVPKYDLTKSQNASTFLKNYNSTIDLLDRFNLHNNMNEVLKKCLVQDVYYGLFYHDDTGAFFYTLDPDYCKIDSRYMTGDFGFAMDMTYWRSAARQAELDWLGEPLVSMYREYERTGVKWVHCDDEYAACFKFRVDDWQLVIPPFLSLFINLINLEDLADVQAVADAQQIYKLIYLPMEVLSGTKQSDDFEISPDLMLEYFNKMLDQALPDYVSAAMVPGNKLDYIDFSDNAAKDTDRVQEASTTILNTSGGGMVLNTSKITTQAGFQAALKCETEFVLSPLLPQIDAFTNRMLIQELGDKAAKVRHFEVSVYTKDDFRKSMLESCQYSYSNKLAYNTLLGISEKETIAMQYLEEEVLKLHDIMKYPLSSSFTQSSNDVGRPASEDGDLSDEGSRSRDRGLTGE